MARIGKGILGGVSGKVGNVVGGNWKGIDYLRILPASVANPKTPKQMDQRTKFMKVISFLQPLTDVIRIGFKAYATKMTAFNAAMSYNFKHSITGSYPDYAIDFSKALLSRGNLSSALNPVVSSDMAAQLSFGWDDNSGDGNALSTDKVMVIAVNPLKEKAIYVLEAASRADGSANLTVPATWSGDTVHCFICMTVLDALINSGNKKAISNSVYAGSTAVT